MNYCHNEHYVFSRGRDSVDLRSAEDEEFIRQFNAMPQQPFGTELPKIGRINMVGKLPIGCGIIAAKSVAVGITVYTLALDKILNLVAMLRTPIRDGIVLTPENIALLTLITTCAISGLVYLVALVDRASYAWYSYQ